MEIVNENDCLYWVKELLRRNCWWCVDGAGRDYCQKWTVWRGWSYEFFVKVELKEEFGENILRAPRRPQSILLQRCWKMKSKGRGGDIWSNAASVKNKLETIQIWRIILIHIQMEDHSLVKCVNMVFINMHLRRHILNQKETTLVCHHCPITFSDQSFTRYPFKGCGSKFQM